MKNNLVKISALITLSLTLLVSCGKGSEEPKQDQPAATTQTEEAAPPQVEEQAPAPLAENELVIEGNDNMQYNLTELKAKAGKPITLTLKHVGKASKKDMGHNLVILKPGTDVEAFAQKAMKDVASDYVPQNDPSIIAHTKLLGGGESDTITFTIDKKGTYDFLCSFPGHYSMMKGKLIIE